MLSVADAAFFRPLPYEDASALVSVWLERPEDAPGERIVLSGADLADFRAEPGLFAALSGWSPRSPILAGAGTAEVIAATAVTEGMFARVLRVQPLLGRTFLPEEDASGAVPVVLLSHALWAEHFGSDPTALGRSVVLDGEPHTVIGVMPPGFRPPFRPDAELWMPARLRPDRRRGCPGVTAIARLATGTPLPIARARAAALGARMEESSPETNGGVVVRLAELRRDRSPISAETLRLLLGAGGVLLLLACGNVAMLLLARGVDRAREMSIRASLGASTPWIVRQLVGEGLILAVLGGIAGLGVAVWGTEAIVSLAPPGLAGLEDVRVEGRILLFTGCLSAAIGVLFGLASAVAVKGRRTDAAWRPAPGAPAGSNAARLVRGGLVVAQVALAMTLTVGSATLLQGLQRATSADSGFEPDGLLAMSVSLADDRFRVPSRRSLLIQELEAALDAMPGAISAGATSALPFDEADADVELRIADDPRPATDGADVVRLQRVSRGFFYTFGQRLVEGREFKERDEEDGVPVVILDVTAARTLFEYPALSPIGARVALGPTDRTPEWRTVVGVVRDARGSPREGESPAVVYVPMTQFPPFTATMIVRVDGDAESRANDARAALAAVDPSLAPTRLETVTELVDSAFALERFTVTLMTVLAAMGLILATVGLYGHLAFGVAVRARDLGVRRALGATDDDLRHHVLARGLGLALVGMMVGALGSWWLFRALEGLLGDVVGLTPLAYASAVALLGLGSLVASARPARRSITIDPVSALRADGRDTSGTPH